MRRFGTMMTVAGLLGGLAAPVAAQQLASPRDSTKVTIAGASIAIDYGRPSMRGRTIMGALVPFGAVWRLGANAATTLKTSKPLMFGSTMVPVGTYTLYAIPDKTSWKLIINKQTGQWGTEYNQDQDLGRVEMKVESLTSPVEQFAIKIEPKGTGGVLRFEWEKTAAVVPFVVH